jgi:hypothetical protein
VTTVKRPSRLFSFTDHQKNNPNAPPPGDRLDAMFIELIDALTSTQRALAEVRRDDGKLNSGLITAQTLDPLIAQKLSNEIIAKVEPTKALAIGNAALARTEAAAASGHARDAEAAAIATAQFLSASQSIFAKLAPNVEQANANAKAAEDEARDAENWATYSQAQSDNAIKAKDEALAWAEFLGGPVVDNTVALDFIQASKFPNGLFYQPVQGMGGMGGLWSAKWWAIYCQQLVGNISFYYLGPSDVALVPGGTNPNTGETIPNPLAVGSFYYDTTTNTVMVWNGTSWQEPGVQVAVGYTANYRYTAAAGQVAFSGPDLNANTPALTNEGSTVYLNGVRLVPTVDYSVNATTDTLTLIEAPGAGAVVQWDLLVPPDKIASVKVDAFKIETLVPDGTKTTFTLTYIDPSTGPPAINANVGTGAQLQVSLDGIIQESGRDYTATGSTLTMTTPPRADSRLWAVWYRPTGGAP